MSDVMLLDELPTACGRRFGLATLNAQPTLNALSLPMVQALTPALRQWAADEGVAGVILQAAGDKAFCAGGDLRELYPSLRSCGAGPNPYAQGFFAQEYELDHLIHSYPKPLLCWGHGIVMGGGIGLLAGASHRVVTSASRLAMPEISIGLYPDVGGSWFLRRMPGRVGLFLALTGAPLNAADALFCGLADLHLSHEHKAEVLAAISAAHWSDKAQPNRVELSKLLQRHAGGDKPLESRLRTHFDTINELMAGEDLLAIAARLRALRSDDAWLMAAAATFAKGSPTSAALAFELQRRVTTLSLAEVFRLEYWASLGCCAHADLAEGIRALLVDKDRNPRWTPATLEQVTPELIEDHFQPRHAGPHPLAALD
ncbi:MAG: enoyl-CoA hydratase/isomerase family protein [Burkholderiaceae bacterium]